MDVLDKKILYELDRDARASFSQIAKRVGSSQETVRYRFKKFEDLGTIQYFLTAIDKIRQGYSYYQLFLKLRNVNEDKLQTIVEELSQRKNLAWVAILEGNFDLGVIFIVKNQLELERFIADFMSKYGKYILSKSVSVNLSAKFFPRDYLIDAKRSAEHFSYKGRKQVEPLDKRNEQICSLLSNNARLSAVEIANSLGASVDNVISRIKSLKKSGVLSSFTIALNHELPNFYHYKYLIYFQEQDEKNINEFLKEISTMKNCIATIKSFGTWDVELDFEVEKIEEQREITMKILEKFSNVIRNYEMLRILKVHKFNFSN